MSIVHANLDGSFETMPTEVVTHDFEVMRFQVSGAQIVPGVRGRGRRGYMSLASLVKKKGIHALGFCFTTMFRR